MVESPDDQLIDLLCQIKTLTEGRELLLRHLPERPVVAMKRSMSLRSDIAGIVEQARRWGWIEDQRSPALVIIVENALRLVEGTSQGSELQRLRAVFLADPELSADGWRSVRSDYFAFLNKEYRDHSIRGFAPQVGGGNIISLPLADIFLPLQAIEGRPALAEYAEEDLRRQAENEVAGELDWRRRREELEKRFAQLSARRAAQRSLSLADLLRHRRAVLLGDPGSGKTTVTRYVTYALATTDLQHIGPALSGLVPVLVRIATYAKALENDPTLHIIDYVERNLFPRTNFGPFLRRSIEAGECLVILDGLDEVGSVGLRTDVTARIQTMVSAHSENAYLVTSRIVGYEQTQLTREFVHATLQELTQSDQESFINLWYKAFQDHISKQLRSEGAEDLIAGLKAKPQIARIAANPLLLTIIVLMHWRSVKLPGQRVLVYQSATDTLIEYWTSQRKVEIDAREVKNILAPIAHHILSSGVSGVIAQQEMLPLFEQGIIEQRGCKAGEARLMRQKMLKDLNEQSGLFLERGTDVTGLPVFGFLHQTFGEYLAALKMAEEVQSGELDLGTYIHRSVWYEPLLLMVGHLSLYSRPQANQVLRSILDHPDPYEEVLHRNLLLAADCLADDIQVRPETHEAILAGLAGLVVDRVPQLREAALTRYRLLADTRHCAAAVAALRQLHPCSDLTQLEQLPVEQRFGLAQALVALKATDLARPLLDSLTQAVRHTSREPELQRLRFEHWPEESANYLLDLYAERGFQATVEVELAACTFGSIDGGLAMRVLGTQGLASLIQTLIAKTQNDKEQTRLAWLALLAQGLPAEQVLDLARTSASDQVRCFAATQLLKAGQREPAIEVLRALVSQSPDQAPFATEALLGADAGSQLDLSLLINIALSSESDAVPEAIGALFRAGHESIALPIALHQIISGASQRAYGADSFKWQITTLLLQRCPRLGIVVARWLALRPGFAHRLDACLALRKAADQMAIVALEILAVESFGEVSQQACSALLELREAERALPVLGHMAAAPEPEQRYLALSALALVGPYSETPVIDRIALKLRMMAQRNLCYAETCEELLDVGQTTLATIDTEDATIAAVVALASAGLSRMTSARSVTQEEYDSCVQLPLATIGLIWHDLRAGSVESMTRSLHAVLQRGENLSPPLLLVALRLLLQLPSVIDAVYTQVVELLQHHTTEVRQLAISVLGEGQDIHAIEPLMLALADTDRNVCDRAAQTLGRIGDVQAVPALLAALADAESYVRTSAARALGWIGDAQALPALLAALADTDRSVRASAAQALGGVGDAQAVLALLAALADAESYVRTSAAQALRGLGDAQAVPALLAALADAESNVRANAAQALEWIGDAQAVPALLTALTEAERHVRASAAQALGRIGDAQAVPALLAALADTDRSVRTSAAQALGQLRVPLAFPALAITTGRSDVAVFAQAMLRIDAIRAAPEIERLTRCYPTHADLRRVQARLLIEMGQPTTAITLLETSLAAKRMDALLIDLALLYCEQGRLERAMTSIDRAIKDRYVPDNVRLARAVTLWLRGERAAAAQALPQGFRLTRTTRFDLEEANLWGPRTLAALDELWAYTKGV